MDYEETASAFGSTLGGTVLELEQVAPFVALALHTGPIPLLSAPFPPRRT